MAAMSGPIEFEPAETASYFVFLGLVPPFLIAVVGSVLHALVAVLAGKREVTLWTLFLSWWGWSTAVWVTALVLVGIFAGG